MDDKDRRKQIMRKAITLLAMKERSRRALARKLNDSFDEGEDDSEFIESVLDELEEKKLLSDERFARVKVQTRSSRYGDMRLKYELRREGVSEEDIETVFEELEDTEPQRAYEIWKRKFGELPEDRKEKARQFRFLASRGFSFKTVQMIVNGEYEEEEEDW